MNYSEAFRVSTAVYTLYEWAYAKISVTHVTTGKIETTSQDRLILGKVICKYHIRQKVQSWSVFPQSNIPKINTTLPGWICWT